MLERLRGKPFSKTNPSRLWHLLEDPDLNQSVLIPPTGAAIIVPWVDGGQKHASQIIVCVNTCIESDMKFPKSEIIRLRNGKDQGE